MTKQPNQEMIASSLIDELHHDVYIAFYEQKMTVDAIASIMQMQPDTIKEMIRTYQERISNVAVTQQS